MPSPSTMNESISSTLDDQNSTPQTYDEERMDTVGAVTGGVVGGSCLVVIIVLLAVCIRRRQISKTTSNIQNPIVFQRSESSQSSVSLDMQPRDDRLNLSINTDPMRESLFADFGNLFRKASTRSAKSLNVNGSLRTKKTKLRKKGDIEKPSYLDRPSKLMEFMRNTFRSSKRKDDSKDHATETSKNVVSSGDRNSVLYSRKSTDVISTENVGHDVQCDPGETENVRHTKCDSGINCDSIEIGTLMIYH